jgi:single-strand DNA-binding protein
MSAPITIQGRLGADPEMRFAASGMAVANLRIVTNGRKNDNGTWVDVDTTWWRVTCFKKLAENVCESLTKGDLVVVVGTVKSREWEDPKTGEKRTAFEVVANVVAADLSRTTAKLVKVDRPSMDINAGVTPGGATDPWATTTQANPTDDPPF